MTGRAQLVVWKLLDWVTARVLMEPGHCKCTWMRRRRWRRRRRRRRWYSCTSTSEISIHACNPLRMPPMRYAVRHISASVLLTSPAQDFGTYIVL